MMSVGQGPGLLVCLYLCGSTGPDCVIERWPSRGPLRPAQMCAPDYETPFLVTDRHGNKCVHKLNLGLLQKKKIEKKK